MVAAFELVVDLAVQNLRAARFIHYKVVKAPALVLCPCTLSQVPITVLCLMRVQMSESVNPSFAQKVAKRCFLLGCEPSILLLSFGSPIQVNILMRHIQISTPNDRLPLKRQLP